MQPPVFLWTPDTHIRGLQLRAGQHDSKRAKGGPQAYYPVPGPPGSTRKGSYGRRVSPFPPV